MVEERRVDCHHVDCKSPGCGALAAPRWTRLKFAMAAAALLVGILSAVPNRNPFRFLNQTIGSGPDALRSIVINNEQTGELLQVADEVGAARPLN